MSASNIYDVLVIGGGINGCGIARDAAGRGLSVILCEKDDLAQATSSASTKLFHGGLRYLEHYEFRLVREALVEREVLLRAMPHISWPMRFVLPHHSGLRPSWILRFGLFLYDHLGGRKVLPATKVIDLKSHPVGTPLKKRYVKGFEYSDCWVEDSRLVILNARDAELHSATIKTRTRVEDATRTGDTWTIQLTDTWTGQNSKVQAKAIINCGGPWVSEILHDRIHEKSKDSIRLVRGSHIVTNKLFDHDKAYIFQQSDGRIIFAIPYEEDFTLIGTTDVDHEGDPKDATCSSEEIDYLTAAASEYFEESVTRNDIVWTYSGVRPLYDDNAPSATEATRDYVLKVHDKNGKMPLLNIFGGKLTTYRKLAEAALLKIKDYFPDAGKSWTADSSLPGGDFPIDGLGRLALDLRARYIFASDRFLVRLVKAYGTDSFTILGDAESKADLGRLFGWDLYEKEVKWLMAKEYARTADDIVWRRSKLGLRLSENEIADLEHWMQTEGLMTLNQASGVKV
jgi:glycerol-3-phosphate dehydrogenase